MLEGKQKDEMKGKINQIPLSGSSAPRRADILAEDSLQQLCDGIKKEQFISLAMDESAWMGHFHDREREAIGANA